MCNKQFILGPSVNGAVLFLVWLCVSISTVSTSIGDTFTDDEDNFSNKRGEFTLTMLTDVRCDKWPNIPRADQTMRTAVRDTVAIAISGDCQCEFDHEQISLKNITCDTLVRDIMYYTGEISPIQSTLHDIDFLLKSIERWVQEQPIITVNTEVIANVSVGITVMDVTTSTYLLECESADGDTFSGNGSGQPSTEPPTNNTDSPTMIMTTEQGFGSSQRFTASPITIIMLIIFVLFSLNAL